MPGLKVLLLCICIIFSSKFLFAQETFQFELEKIEFQGNKFFSSSVLEDVIYSKQTPVWISKSVNHIYYKLGRKASYFDTLLIREDLDALNLFYKDNGFFETKFTYSYKLDGQNKKAELVYNINEGPRFIVRNHRITGISGLPDDLYTKLSEYRLDSSKFYSKILLNEANGLLISCLRDNGYMLAKSDLPRVNIDTVFNYVDISVNINPGIRYFIDSLKVVKRGLGKDDIEDDLITRIAGLKPYDCYSAYEKQRAQVRLYRTNLFSSVMISAIIMDTLDYHVPLTISADVGSLQELSPELILNNIDNSFNFGFGANFSKKNFFGNARTFTLSGNLAVQDIFKPGVLNNLHKFFNLTDNTMGYVDIRASVEQPYLFEEPIISRLETYWTENKKVDYKSFTIGSKLSFSFELPKYVYLSSLNIYYSVEGSRYDFQEDSVVTFFSKKNAITVDSAKNIVNRLKSRSDNSLQLSNNWELTSILGCDIGINKTNDLLFPTKGYNLSLTVEEANTLPTILNKLGIGNKPKSVFYRLLSAVSFFPNIYNSPTSAFGIKFKSGYLHTFAGDKNIVPLNKRFTAGGSNSVRGWRARDLVPIKTNDSNQDNLLFNSNSDLADYLLKNYPLGGAFLLEGSFETRNRIFDKFGMAAFVDYGNTWEGYEDFSLKDIAVAVGFGFRYYSSFAPIRVDLGFQAYDPKDKKNLFKKYNESGIWNMMTLHLGIGEAF